jgi:transcriptional regulator with XRE-family HTH domain
MTDTINNLKALLTGGEGAPDYAPDGLLALRKLSVEKLARASNITRTAVYNYINNVNRPTDYVLKSMSEALSIPYAEMLSYCTPAPFGRPRTRNK